AVEEYLRMANDATMNAISLFVEGTTEKYQEKYQLPITGMMQEIRDDSRPRPVARRGGWTVGYPLKEYGAEIAITHKDLAYMNPADFQAHIDGVLGTAQARIRHEMLYRLLNNTDNTFDDDRQGEITVKPLASGEAGVLFPPVRGTMTEATEDHYLESGYAAASISDTNNPVKTLADDVTHHGVNSQTDIPCVTLINPAQQAQIEGLTKLVEYVPPAVQRGADTAQILMPPVPVPGNRVIGYMSGLSWVAVYDWIPTNYLITVNLGAPAPLKMRVHTSDSRLGTGLKMKSGASDGIHTYNNWELDFGIGTGNRLGAAVMELGTGGTYTIPAAYS
ncbi:MAG: hypothetical protein ACPG7F_15820, partial [Aggregatilineales bacterium]